jgi:predicted DNA-binding transcriptional regulator YafY
MHRNWALGALQLNSAEAIDLLLSIVVAERLNSPVLLRHLSAIKRKIVAGFSNAHHTRIRSLRQRILIGQPASKRVLATYAPLRSQGASAIAEAFLTMRCIEIAYVNENGTFTTRVIEPQFLYLNIPVWYLLAWDRLRGAVRFFRIDRIAKVALLPESFRLGDPAVFLAEGEPGAQAL